MALVYKKILSGDTVYAIWKIEEDPETLLNQLQLKAHEYEYLRTLNNGKRNLHWLSTRALLRKLIDTPDYIDCKVDEHGKPYLENFPHNISLSHSYDYAAVMISKTKTVGIDIELIKDKIERIAGKFLSPEELLFISGDMRIEQLYACWCAKEAVYKLHGKKNISFLEDMRISPFLYPAHSPIQCVLQTSQSKCSYDVEILKYDNYMVGYATG